MLPIWITGALVLVAFLIVVSDAVRGRGAGTRRPVDRGLERWAQAVQFRLPRAFDALQLAPAGHLKAGRRPGIVMHGPGTATTAGWQWTIELPGSTVDDDVDPERLAGAINQGAVMVDVIEVRRRAAGWADVTAYRTDPLKLDNRIPFQPGALPVHAWGDRWSLGRARDGREVRLPLWLPGGGAHHAMYSGATGSGKTRWMLVGIAHAMQLGAEIYLVDLVKGVDDRDWQPIHRGLVDAWDKPADAVKSLTALLDDTLARPRWEPRDPGRFRLVVIDEMQALVASKPGAAILTRLVAEGRSKGLAVFGATQLPLTTQISSIARTNFRVKMAGRLDNEAEYRAALGGKWPGSRIADDAQHWGVGYVDLDGRGAQRFRGWHVSDGWLREHTRRCGKA